MIQWTALQNEGQIAEIIQLSHSVPCLIFKHSTRCNISSMAKARLEQNWSFSMDEIKPYYLDLLSFRALSDAVADKFNIYHESPQVLLIRDGECTYDASHLDISVEELAACYAD
ncbi:MAG: bacillithiol system redox-active protein YtxJ [Saprospiraceae bacterium]|nr:bacillithiol system redox-active protein YtxJ [Saprospiraceae bacterium]